MITRSASTWPRRTGENDRLATVVTGLRFSHTDSPLRSSEGDTKHVLSAESDEEKQHWYGVLRAYSHLSAEQVASAANVRSSFSLDAEADQERLPTPVQAGGKAVRRPRRSSFETDPSAILSAVSALQEDEHPEEAQADDAQTADTEEVAESEEYQLYATGD